VYRSFIGHSSTT